MFAQMIGKEYKQLNRTNCNEGAPKAETRRKVQLYIKINVYANTQLFKSLKCIIKFLLVKIVL